MLLCLGFSKKLANLTYAVALYFAHYNFCRVHKTLETTPAVAAAITERPWTLEEMLEGRRECLEQPLVKWEERSLLSPKLSVAGELTAVLWASVANAGKMFVSMRQAKMGRWQDISSIMSATLSSVR